MTKRTVLIQIFRHGDRTPITESFYPNYPYSNSSDWSSEWTQLTTLGKNQLFSLGKWLRYRYNTRLLDTVYKFDQIYVQSSDTDRTITSANTCLAGLYPPTENQKWMDDLLWQPIPVHIVPKAYDKITLADNIINCEFYRLLRKNAYASSEIQEIKFKHKLLLDFLTEHTGFPINGTNEVFLYSFLVLYLFNISIKTNKS